MKIPLKSQLITWFTPFKHANHTHQNKQQFNNVYTIQGSAHAKDLARLLRAFLWRASYLEPVI
jgi:hypothetical protein